MRFFKQTPFKQALFPQAKRQKAAFGTRREKQGRTSNLRFETGRSLFLSPHPTSFPQLHPARAFRRAGEGGGVRSGTRGSHALSFKSPPPLSLAAALFLESRARDGVSRPSEQPPSSSVCARRRRARPDASSLLAETKGTPLEEGRERDALCGSPVAPKLPREMASPVSDSDASGPSFGRGRAKSGRLPSPPKGPVAGEARNSPSRQQRRRTLLLSSFSFGFQALRKEFLIARFPPGKARRRVGQGREAGKAALTSLALPQETLKLKPPFGRRWARGGESWSWLGEGRCGVNEPLFRFLRPGPVPVLLFFFLLKIWPMQPPFLPGGEARVLLVRRKEEETAPLAGSSLFLQTFWILFADGILGCSGKTASLLKVFRFLY